jgi:hypothetical protein
LVIFSSFGSDVSNLKVPKVAVTLIFQLWAL